VIAWRLLPLLILLAACGSWRSPALVAPLPPNDREQLVRQAETKAQAGAYAEAARLFEEALRQPSATFRDRALVGLTRVLVDSENAGRDYRRAYLAAERLAREYPDSAYAAEARAWRDLLGSYLARGEELERRAQERERLKYLEQELEQRTQELERLKHLDQELEQRTQEVERLRQELKRLKILDVELERRTQELERLSYELERRNRELDQLKRLDLELEQQKKKP
jgi:outer membrane protein assembly factor BamD (BamD/ComL family)